VVSSAQMIITRWGKAQAVSLSSPQLPGIVAAFDADPTAVEIMSIAKAAGLAEDGEFDVHIEETLCVEDTQYFVRARHDFRADLRLAVLDRILHELRTNKEVRDHAAKDDLDDVIFIAALPSDTISATIATARAGQPLNVASVNPVTESLACVAVVHDAAEATGPSLGELGLGPDSPVEKLLQMEPELRRHSRDHELIQL
jgi:hypothetical protein